MAREKKYSVIADTNLSNFAKTVTEQIGKGWNTNGGVSTAVVDGKATFYQALTWKAEKPKVKKTVL